MTPYRARAFALTDLCIALALLALLFGGALPQLLGRTSETAHRVKCAGNLRQIGQAIQIYAAANGGLPVAMSDGRGSTPTQYTNPFAPDPFKVGAPGPNDVTAALFLLVRTTGLGVESLVCPTAPGATPWDFGGRTAGQVSNVPGRQYLSYSYLNVYATPEATAAGFVPSPALGPNFAVAADMNPGGPAVLAVTPSSDRQRTRPANSRNHNGDGQNVLYADGHIEFHYSPFCGPLRTPAGGGATFRDNIYTGGAGWGGQTLARASPVDALDSILLPTAMDGPVPAIGTQPRTLLIRAIVAAAVVGFILVFLLRRGRKAPAAPPSV